MLRSLWEPAFVLSSPVHRPLAFPAAVSPRFRTTCSIDDSTDSQLKPDVPQGDASVSVPSSQSGSGTSASMHRRPHTEDPAASSDPSDARRPPAPSKDPTLQSTAYSMRARLREETEAPFRKVRQFLFVGSALSASVGAFISGLRIVAALAGVRGTQPIAETSQNLAINVAVIALCVYFWKLEQEAGARRLERLSRGAKIANLLIEDATTGQVQRLAELRSRFRVVIIAGPLLKLAATLQEANKVRDQLSQMNIMVVPVPVDIDHPSPSTHGYESTDWPQSMLPLGSWIARPLRQDLWLDWLESEKQQSSRTELSPENVLVVVVKLNGKVGSRSIGSPSWPALVATVSRFAK